MIVPLLLSLTLATPLGGDPRPELVELQIAGRRREALARVDRLLAEQPDAARPLGLDYLRGALLESLAKRPGAKDGREMRSAVDAFAAAMGGAPVLLTYSRYRLALAQERANHPEVAAGLIATAVAADPGSELLPDAVRLLVRTLAKGGDCRLLQGLAVERMKAPEGRQIILAEADCANREGQRETARGLLTHLLRDERGDDAARQAADRLARLVPDPERGEAPRLIGLAFEQHRDFERALKLLQRAFATDGERNADFEVAYATARSQFWLGRYAFSGALFRELAKRTNGAEEKAAALYQEARSFELLGHWKTASATFRQAYLANPGGEWAGAALFSALRLDWRGGDEGSALPLYEQLSAHLPWREHFARASLFLAASDLVRHRGDRARAWLDRAAAAGNRDDQVEVAYWRGRLAELAGDPRGAVAAYLGGLRLDLHHPLSRAAFARLRSPGLARVSAAEGRRLAASTRVEDLGGAWMLLGDADPVGALARRKLRQALLADRGTAAYVRLAETPVDRWPLWQANLKRPEELLLALGLWHEGARAVREHFPLADPSLAYTAALQLSRAGETRQALDLAEDLRQRVPDRLPLALQPEEFARLLYPLSFRETLAAQGKRWGIDPLLLAAVLREESRFDPRALSAASARGLSQLVMPTARRIAGPVEGKALKAEDLYRPEISISLGAAYLEELLRAFNTFNGTPQMAVAAYNAGKPQVQLWRSYCYSQEPEEFYTKIGFRETRSYVRRVLTSWSQYGKIYS